MTEPIVAPGAVTDEQYRAALEVFAASGASIADVESGLRALVQSGVPITPPSVDSVSVLLSSGSYHAPGIPPTLAQVLNAPERRRAVQGPDHRCHRCNAPATTQWNRHATADEAEAWHAGREQWIRAHNDGRPEAQYVSDRGGTVTMAVFGCDDHDLSPAPADDANAAGYEARQIGVNLRTLTHDADCGGHGACQCGNGDA